jgi:hypothetical protein
VADKLKSKERLAELISELEMESKDSGQSLGEWLECVRSMRIDLQSLEECVADEVSQTEDDGG